MEITTDTLPTTREIDRMKLKDLKPIARAMLAEIASQREVTRKNTLSAGISGIYDDMRREMFDSVIADIRAICTNDGNKILQAERYRAADVAAVTIRRLREPFVNNGAAFVGYWVKLADDLCTPLNAVVTALHGARDDEPVTADTLDTLRP